MSPATTIATMIELLLYPLLAGVLLATLTGPLGAFMVWKRMAFFGDTIAHGALVGVAFGIMLSVHTSIAIGVAALLSAAFLSAMRYNNQLPTDTLLGIISHGSLAIGLVMVGVMADQRLNLMALLLGDILTVTGGDLATILIVALICLSILYINWRAFLLSIIDPDLAQVEGHNTRLLMLVLTVMMAITIAVAVKIVGVLLVTALMIIPAASSRLISKSPEAMMLFATCFGILAVMLGLFASATIALPAGPAIVTAALILFLVGYVSIILLPKKS